MNYWYWGLINHKLLSLSLGALNTDSAQLQCFVNLRDLQYLNFTNHFSILFNSCNSTIYWLSCTCFGAFLGSRRVIHHYLLESITNCYFFHLVTISDKWLVSKSAYDLCAHEYWFLSVAIVSRELVRCASFHLVHFYSHTPEVSNHRTMGQTRTSNLLENEGSWWVVKDCKVKLLSLTWVLYMFTYSWAIPINLSNRIVAVLLFIVNWGQALVDCPYHFSKPFNSHFPLFTDFLLVERRLPWGRRRVIQV